MNKLSGIKDIESIISDFYKDPTATHIEINEKVITTIVTKKVSSNTKSKEEEEEINASVKRLLENIQKDDEEEQKDEEIAKKAKKDTNQENDCVIKIISKNDQDVNEIEKSESKD